MSDFLSDPAPYISVAAPAVTLATWCLMADEFRERGPTIDRAILAFTYAIFFAIDKIMFFSAAADEARAAFGVPGAAIPARAIAYGACAIAIWFAVAALRRGVLSPESLTAFAPALFCIGTAQALAAFVGGSVVGVAIGLLNLIGTIGAWKSAAPRPIMAMVRVAEKPRDRKKPIQTPVKGKVGAGDGEAATKKKGKKKGKGKTKAKEASLEGGDDAKLHTE